MASNLIKVSALIGTMLCLPATSAMAMSYWEEMDTMDAQIELINKRNELGNALKSGSSTLSLPSIVSIIEDGRGATAKLVFDNGLVRWVNVGDELIGGVKVTRISSSGVQVRVKKTSRWLPFQVLTPDGQPAPASGNQVTVAADVPLTSLPPMEPRRVESQPPAPLPARPAQTDATPAVVGSAAQTN